MPSVYSFSIARPRPSSTVITPSLPTLSITSAMREPISGSAAEIEATWAISSWVSTGLLIDLISSMTASAPFSSPLRRIMGFAPAARFLKPSVIMACASTVAVVVPSPATSFVLVATSLSNCAPMFSKGSGRSISRATVTPSFVIVGAPNFLSSTTLRPLGPSVTFTTSASVSIPFSVYLDFGTAILGEQYLLSNLYLQRYTLAVVKHFTRTHCQDFTLLGLLFRGIWQHDATFSNSFTGCSLDHYTIAQWPKLYTHCWHSIPPYFLYTVWVRISSTLF